MNYRKVSLQNVYNKRCISFLACKLFPKSEAPLDPNLIPKFCVCEMGNFD